MVSSLFDLKVARRNGTNFPLKTLIIIPLAVLLYCLVPISIPPIPSINTYDQNMLRHVFFNEGPVSKTFIVLCHHNDIKINLPIYEPFIQAHHEFIHDHDVDFYLIDCSAVLPDSGKTISDRFNLGMVKHEVTIFISGNSGLPEAIPPDYHKSTKDLIHFIKTKTRTHIYKIKTSIDLKSKCFSRSACCLIFKPKSFDDKFVKMMRGLLKKYKDVRFCTVESEHVLVPHVEEHLPLYDGNIRIVVFQSDNSKGESVLSFSYLNQVVDYKNMNQLLKRAVQKNNTDWKKLPLIPYIQIRSKKNEKLDIKKRQRLKKKDGKIFGELKIRNHPDYKDKIKENKRRKGTIRQEDNIVGRRDYDNIRDENIKKKSDKVLEEYSEEDILDLD